MILKPMISIIVPYYNTEKYLARCLDSIVSQSYQNLEILMINDGSSDKSAEIVDEYAKKDIRVQNITVPHGGVSAARNAGLKKAAGDYIIFADADDWLAEDSIRKMMEVMQETGADLVTSNIRRVSDPSENVKEQAEGYTLLSRDDFMRVLFRIGSNEPVHYPVAKLYKKALLPENLYPEGIRVGEDVLGTYRAAKNVKSVAKMDLISYYYFYNPESVTEEFSDKKFDLIPVWDMTVQEAEGIEPDHEYAVLNRKRINFGLLLLLVTEVPAKVRKEKYSEIESTLLKDLKASEEDLLNAPIVSSRKKMIKMLCNHYPLCSFLGNIYIKLSRLTGKRLAVGQRSNLS